MSSVKMLKLFTCDNGFHNWSIWSEIKTREGMLKDTYYQERSCSHCNTAEQKPVKQRAV